LWRGFIPMYVKCGVHYEANCKKPFRLTPCFLCLTAGPDSLPKQPSNC
jgi:hypothetical protein